MRLVARSSAALLLSLPACATQPEAPPLPVSVTAYCVSGTTRSGEPTRRGIVAADPRVLPLGSVIRVEGLPDPHNGRYTVADTGKAVKGNVIDVYMPDCRAARRFGRQRADVYVEELPSGDAGAE